MRNKGIFKAVFCMGLVGLLATAAYGQTEVRMGGSVAGECTDDSQCDDGDLCNGFEWCDVGSGQCQPGTSPCFDDGNVCTIEFCDPILGCINDAGAADGDPCGDQSDTDCSNPDSCSGGACDPNNEADGTVCDDGLACTEGDTCTGGVCQPDGPPNCCDSDCCVANASLGCNVAGCEESVCSILPICCDYNPKKPDNYWDQECANLAVDICVVCGGNSNCCTPGLQNGCDAQSCQDCVCAIDPWCCGYPWDSVCVGEAANECQTDCPCDTEVPLCFFGDITNLAGGLCVPQCTGSPTNVDLDDVLCALVGFEIPASCPCADIKGSPGPNACIPNGVIDFDDIVAILNAFAGIYDCPAPCP